MARRITREEFATPQGRKRAWRALMLSDHGFLRKRYDNSWEIAPGLMWRSYQPSPKDLTRWKDRGIRTVVNLRGEGLNGPYLLEEDTCRKLGLTLIPFQVFSREPPSKDNLHGARALFKEIEYPALIHCKSGADRAGLMATLYMFFSGARPLDAAMEQMAMKYGHFKRSKTGIIDFVFEQYIAYAQAHDIPLSSVDDFFRWVDDIYDPAAAKEAFKSGFLANTLTDKILRRE